MQQKFGPLELRPRVGVCVRAHRMVWDGTGSLAHTVFGPSHLRCAGTVLPKPQSCPASLDLSPCVLSAEPSGHARAQPIPPSHPRWLLSPFPLFSPVSSQHRSQRNTCLQKKINEQTLFCRAVLSLRKSERKAQSSPVSPPSRLLLTACGTFVTVDEPVVTHYH